MATFFGEVVFDSSRSSDEDEEDDEGSETRDPDSEVVVTWLQEVREVSLRLFLLAHGPLAEAFAQQLLRCNSAQLIATIKTTHDHSNRDVKTKKIEAPTLYLVDGTVMVFLCPKDFPPTHMFNLCDQILKYLQQADKVVILTSEHISAYKCIVPVAEMQKPFLRSLSSSCLPEKSPETELEQPNTISGIPAAVLTLCEIKSLPAVMYITYADTDDIDSLTLKPFHSLLEITNYFVHLKFNSEAVKATSMPTLVDKGNTYM